MSCYGANLVASWIGVALVASRISICTGIFVAMAEIFLGTLAGYFWGSISSLDYVLAVFGSIVLALGVLFANFNRWMLVFVVVTCLALWMLPRLSRWMFAKWSGRVSEPEVKFIFLVLCFRGPLVAFCAAANFLALPFFRAPAGSSPNATRMLPGRPDHPLDKLPAPAYKNRCSWGIV